MAPVPLTCAFHPDRDASHLLADGTGRCSECMSRRAATSLISDILELARHCAGKRCPAAPAAERILSAQANGGLTEALLGQVAGALESRLVGFLRTSTRELMDETP